MFLLIWGKRDVAFSSLWAVFVSRQFREINFVTALRDVGGSGERSSSGGSELPLGNTEPPSEAAGAGQEESREEAGRGRGGCHGSW